MLCNGECRGVEGYPGYYVSSQGQVYSAPRKWRRKGLILKAYDNGSGYLYVRLSKNNVVKNFYIHHLVAYAFIGPRPDGCHICHNDGNKRNNAISNLRYGTAKENYADDVSHGKRGPGEMNRSAKLTDDDIRDIRRDSRPHKEIAEDYGVHKSNISHIKRGVTWKHI